MGPANHFEKIESYLPASLLSAQGFLTAIIVVYGFVVLRYFLLVGVFYFYFWQWRPNPFTRLYATAGKGRQIRKEIQWSLLTSVIFALSGVLIGWLWELGYTRIYLNFDEYPLWWMPVSVLAFAFFHEIYFYVSHRWMHRPQIYRRIHAVHHLSLEPSPWASFCFHPVESLIESAILPILVCLIPIHPVMFIAYLTLMTLSAINNHLGQELMPQFLRKIGLAKWLISATHHSQHHRFYRCNYGLYFTFMDRWLGTEREV